MRTIAVKKKNSLSATKEDYLRAIYLLKNTTGTASVTAIAKRLGLSKSTVSERLKGLTKEGLVDASPYSEIKLTQKGEQISQKLTYKHRIIEVFLNRILKLPIADVHDEAEKLEHACSDEVIKRLARFLDNPTTDPHGTKISTPKNW